MPYITCNNCNGKGRLLCPTCHGKALINGCACKRCSDEGIIFNIGRRLRGNINCTKCNGSGTRYISQEENDAWLRQKENQRAYGNGGNRNSNGGGGRRRGRNNNRKPRGGGNRPTRGRY